MPKIVLNAKREARAAGDMIFSLMERDDSYMCTSKSKKYTHLIKTGLCSTAYKLFLLSKNINQLWKALKGKKQGGYLLAGFWRYFHVRSQRGKGYLAPEIQSSQDFLLSLSL